MIWIEINKNSKITLTRQLYDQIRKHIFSKKLRPGEKMPSTRALSRQLAVSRNIIINVYEQLIVEGYLHGSEGSGTFVSGDIEFKDYHTLFIEKDDQKPRQKKAMTTGTTNARTIDFSIGVPDLEHFPRQTWSRLSRDSLVDIENDSLNYSSSQGAVCLRETLTDFLYKLKGIRCDTEQIFLVPGATAGIQVLSQMLKKQFETVFLEDPSYIKIQKIFKNVCYRVCPVCVDRQGIVVQSIHENQKGLVVVTPAHHFPTGSVLSIQRRIALIEYARKNASYIIENDYDSEFRYNGPPINSLQSMDPERVFHVGSFSQLLFPSLRIGYVIVPEQFVPRMETAVSENNYIISTVKQLVLNSFIQGKHMERHYKKMLRSYRLKRKKIISELVMNFNDDIIIHGDDAGLYIMVEFKHVEFTDDLFNRLKKNGAIVHSVSDHCIDSDGYKNKIIFGYGNVHDDQIVKGVRIISDILNG